MGYQSDSSMTNSRSPIACPAGSSPVMSLQVNFEPIETTHASRIDPSQIPEVSYNAPFAYISLTLHPWQQASTLNPSQEMRLFFKTYPVAADGEATILNIGPNKDFPAVGNSVDFNLGATLLGSGNLSVATSQDVDRDGRPDLILWSTRQGSDLQKTVVEESLRVYLNRSTGNWACRK